MPTVVNGPWKTPVETNPRPPVDHSRALLLALLVALSVATFSYIAYHVLTPVEPSRPAVVYAGQDHPDGLREGRWYPDDSMRTGTWRTEVLQGQTCGYALQSRASGPSDSVRSTPGTLIISVTSSVTWVEFTGPCVWFREG